MEPGSKGRRIRRAGIGFAIGALFLAAYWVVSSRERRLMEVARPIKTVEASSEKYFWLSGHQLLLLDTQQEAGVSYDTYDNRTPVSWQGFADLLDTTTHTQKRLTELTRLLNHTGVKTDTFHLSPDGGTVMWQDTSRHEDGRISLCMARSDGTHYRHWTSSADDRAYYLDPRHILQISASEPEVIVRDMADAAQDRKFACAQQARTIVAEDSAVHPIAIGVSASDAHGKRGCAEIGTYRTDEGMARMLAGEEPVSALMQPNRKQTVQLPAGATLQEGAASPELDAILYHLHRVHNSLLRTWLHRILPTSVVEALNTDELWISRTDGSALHEIGFLPIETSGGGTPTYSLTEVQWLPGGKQISFLYHDTLYVTSVTTQR